LLRFPLFDAVHHRDFRYLWLGQSCTSMAMWMDQVARSWLLYELTSSPLQLGLLQGLQMIPMLVLSPVAGTAADRFDRKVQIMAAQITDAVTYAILAVLIIAGYRTRWVCLVLAGFCVVTALLFHSNFADRAQVFHFLKNAAIAGGLLALYVTGPGRLSLDAMGEARS
jgi:uncharacterized membrane protein YphA (DoxX/SURF4 family)